jgi:hypothetical protein
MTKENTKYYTTYNIATHWLDGGLVLCNEIVNIDSSIWDNMRFDYFNEKGDSQVEVYQWFLTNWNESDVEWLEKNFPDLLFTYSEKLDCFVLCVDHFGTMWSGVECEVSEELAKHNKDILITEENKNPTIKKTREY